MFMIIGVLTPQAVLESRILFHHVDVETLHHVHEDSKNGPQPRTQNDISELFIEVIEVSSLDCHANELVIPM